MLIKARALKLVCYLLINACAVGRGVTVNYCVLSAPLRMCTLYWSIEELSGHSTSTVQALLFFCRPQHVPCFALFSDLLVMYSG